MEIGLTNSRKTTISTTILSVNLVDMERKRKIGIDDDYNRLTIFVHRFNKIIIPIVAILWCLSTGLAFLKLRMASRGTDETYEAYEI